MTGGRPTKYDPAYCEKVIHWGKQGKSRTWIASELDITRECLYEWMRVHPSFSDALTRAKIHEQRFWEDAGQVGMTGDKFNGGVWAKNMSCRFPSEWRDTQDVNHGPQDSIADLLKSLDGALGRLPTRGS